MALSCLTKQDKYLDLCLDTIRNAILVGAVAGLSYDPTAKMEQEEVVVRLPVRVNWGGGWSDTPPYCMEHGGTVLNAAVKLDGQNPVEAVVKRFRAIRSCWPARTAVQSRHFLKSVSCRIPAILTILCPA